MSRVLGISAGYHDAAAALIIDGQLIAAMQEERFTRIKNDSSIPSQAVFACLAQAGLTPAAIDRVVFYENPFAKLERVLLSLVRSFPQSWKQFPAAISALRSDKLRFWGYVLLHRNRLGKISWLVYISAFQDRYMVG
jgi:carbamoyltransferase